MVQRRMEGLLILLSALKPQDINVIESQVHVHGSYVAFVRFS